MDEDVLMKEVVDHEPSPFPLLIIPVCTGCFLRLFLERNRTTWPRWSDPQ